MNYETILENLYAVLEPLAKDDMDLDESTELIADLALDSVQVMDLLMQIEDRFDISIPLNVIPDVHTVKDLALQIEKLVESE